MCTQLSCDISPGAARDSYSVQWFQLNSGSSFSSVSAGIGEDFSLTLHVSLSSDRAEYMCTVTIDHDGTGNAIAYDGARITVRTTGKCNSITKLILSCQQRVFAVPVPVYLCECVCECVMCVAATVSGES